MNTRKKSEEIEDKELSKSSKKAKKSKKVENVDDIEDEVRVSKRKLIKLILLFLVILIFGSVIKLGISFYRWKLLATDMFINESSVVLDFEGNVIATLGSNKRKETVSFDSIPDNLKNAYVAIEDQRFYSHGGVDVKRSAAAVFSYVTHFGSSSFGGSTITQQLVKNMTGSTADTASRKLDEWVKSYMLETFTSKDEILNMYLNIIYVGPNVYGVGTGAKYYFNKPVTDLTLEECAFLAGINIAPNSFNPFTEKNNSEKIAKRTRIVLNKMKELNYISQEELDAAIASVNTGLKFEKGEISSESAVYSYHTDSVIQEVTEEIAKKYKITETFAMNYLETAGVKIYSTQDSKIQKEIELEFEKKQYILPSKIGNNSSQAAMVIIEHKTGYVLGCVGGLGKKDSVRPLNRVTQSIRQTGSAIKPLAILAPAIDKKIITASSIYDDTEKDFEKGYHPLDYTSPLGLITVRRAVESSQNVPFVEIMEQLTPNTSMKYLKNMGISSLTSEDANLALALGGLDSGISPLEMTAGYATIANDGQYIEPSFYTLVEKRNGKPLIKSKQKKKVVLSKESAYIVKELLTQPILGENGTARYCKVNNISTAAKTGTTDDNYDRWLCGFTPYYTATTWFGYDINESIEFNGLNPAGSIWSNVMNKIHSNLPSASFEKPSKVIYEIICTDTGKKATTNCTHTIPEYFLKDTVPDLCTAH